MIKKSKALLELLEKYQDLFQNGYALADGFKPCNAHEVGLKAQVAINFINAWVAKSRAANHAPAGPSPAELKQTETIAKRTAETNDPRDCFQQS